MASGATPVKPSTPPANSNEAVCFTAGVNGIPFAAGTIHAYLASGRKKPRVAAGISCGALSAAAMQRCYREVEEVTKKPSTGEQREFARWSWFSRYIDAICDKPYNVIWNAIPDIADFF